MAETRDSHEFVRLWTAHSQRVYAYILTMLANRADADEIFQDTATTLWEKFAQFQPAGNFRAWARSVALNKVRNFRQLRRHSTVLLSNETIELVGQMAINRSDTLDREHAALADCYSKLPERDSELLDLRYETGATVRSVAQHLSRSPEAVYKRLARIHRMLYDCVRKTLEEEGLP